MKRFVIFIALSSLLSSSVNAQLWKLRRVELTGGIGATQLFGDIGGFPNSKNILGFKDFTVRHIRFNINGNVRYRIDEAVSVRLNLMSGLFHSTDERGSNIRRGFEETTIFFESAVIGEFYFIKNKAENSFVFLKGNNSLLKSMFQSLDFYFFTGAGALIYKVSPNAFLESQQLKTSGLTGVIPLGIGTSMIYSGKLNFGIEVGGRFSNSDFIDGFSTNSTIRKKDVYHVVTFSFTYKINTGKKSQR